MGRISHDGKLQKFSTSMITRLIDSGRLPIERLVKHVQYLQRSVAWLSLCPACSTVIVAYMVVLRGHLRNIVQPGIWVRAASVCSNVTRDFACARRIVDSPECFSAADGCLIRLWRVDSYRLLLKFNFRKRLSVQSCF